MNINEMVAITHAAHADPASAIGAQWMPWPRKPTSKPMKGHAPGKFQGKPRSRQGRSRKQSGNPYGY